jgi:hypothetical protein
MMDDTTSVRTWRLPASTLTLEPSSDTKSTPQSGCTSTCLFALQRTLAND